MANFPTEYGTSPVGRIVMGDPWNKQTRDQNGREIPADKQRFFFGLAVEKTAPGVDEMLGTLQKAATAGYASVQNVMAQVQMGLGATAFSWKVQDGDEMVTDPQTGQQSLRNKYSAGCWIFKFSQTLPIRPAKYQGNVPVDCTPDEIKRGYYAQVAYSTSANGNTDHTAGIYLNPQTVCLVGHGQEIVGGPSLDQQFTGGPGSYMPAGMSQTPQAPTGAPGAAPAPQGMPQRGAPAPQGMPQQGAPAPAPNPMGSAMPQQQPPAQPAPANPMNAGGGMPAPNGQNGGTTSPGNNQPQPYGGYMGQ